MKRTYRIVINAHKKNIKKALENFEFKTNEGMTVLKFGENDSRVDEVMKYLENVPHVKSFEIEYSNDDYDSANYYIWRIGWENGYPEPNDSYRDHLFDSDSFCSTCSANKIQISPFRIKGEPKWGKKAFMSLNWEYSTLFTTPEKYQEIFEPLGIECMNVLSKSGEALSTVVQVLIPELDDDLNMERRSPYNQCEICHTRKYEHIKDGNFPDIESSTSFPIFKPRTLFGSGLNADKLIVVNKKLYELLRSEDPAINLTPMGVALNNR